MEWIKSGGGPLVCVERELAHLWRGTLVSGGEDAPALAVSDYERACQVRDYLGVANLNHGSALILGDMPLATSVWIDSSGRVGIVRLFYLDRDADVSSILGKIDDSLFNDPDETLNFEVASNQMMIFDSAASGADKAERALFFE
jgi:hypothetical protein